MGVGRGVSCGRAQAEIQTEPSEPRKLRGRAEPTQSQLALWRQGKNLENRRDRGPLYVGKNYTEYLETQKGKMLKREKWEGRGRGVRNVSLCLAFLQNTAAESRDSNCLLLFLDVIPRFPLTPGQVLTCQE